MSDNPQPASTLTTTAATTYPAYPDNPFFEDTRGDIDVGEYQARCIDYEIVENHERYKYGTTEVEKADFVAFCFEITAGPCKGEKIASSMLNISMYRLSRLYAFLSGWLAREPEEDFQPESFVDATATITIGVFPGKKNPDIRFARISAIAPGNDTDENAEGKNA